MHEMPYQHSLTMPWKHQVISPKVAHIKMWRNVTKSSSKTGRVPFQGSVAGQASHMEYASKFYDSA
jgi:hypothetical protein